MAVLLELQDLLLVPRQLTQDLVISTHFICNFLADFLGGDGTWGGGEESRVSLQTPYVDTVAVISGCLKRLLSMLHCNVTR